MPATIGSIKGKVLIQIGDNDPVEVGAIDIPLRLETPRVGPTIRGADLLKGNPRTSTEIQIDCDARINGESISEAIGRIAANELRGGVR